MKKTYLYLAIVMFSISTLIMAISFRNSFALPTDWYTSFTYEKDEGNSTITLTRYNGTDTEVTIPATATISGKTYSVIVSGNSTKTNSLFSGNTSLTKVTFQEGVKAGSSLEYLF